jgi:transcription termination/antitermination protein NusG
MKKWYVVQVFAGYENIIKADIEKKIEEQNLQDLFGSILIPSAKMKQLFVGPEAAKDQQLFPGYMLIEMEGVEEAFRLVKSTARIVRLLSTPISKREMERIDSQVKGEVVVAREVPKFEMGREVEIKEGPFSGFMGIVENIDDESEKLTVMVSIFGRMTPVELSFDQVRH